MKESIGSLLVIALLAERLVEIGKYLITPFLKEWAGTSKRAFWQGLGLVLGIILAFQMNINFFEIIQAPGAPWLGKLLAGLFAGMGTQWVHEILSNLPSEAARNFRSQTDSRNKKGGGK
jgi:fructose-specific phosphotransferase system IIC component